MPDGRQNNGRLLQYTEDELLGGLRRLAERHDRVTRKVVRDYAPFSSGVLTKRFGSFNDAKEAAGLEIYDHGGGIWRTENGVRGRDYYDHLLDIAECCVCGEDRPPCIEFHHVDGEKKIGVAVAGRSHTAERTYEEAQKTIPLCANCHKRHHSAQSELDVSDRDATDWPHPNEVNING